MNQSFRTIINVDETKYTQKAITDTKKEKLKVHNCMSKSATIFQPLHEAEDIKSINHDNACRHEINDSLGIIGVINK